MILSRTKANFRYPDDPREVTIVCSKEEAYEIAFLLSEQRRHNGLVLKNFLTNSEDSNADLIKT